MRGSKTLVFCNSNENLTFLEAPGRRQYSWWAQQGEAASVWNVEITIGKLVVVFSLGRRKDFCLNGWVAGFVCGAGWDKKRRKSHQNGGPLQEQSLQQQEISNHAEAAEGRRPVARSVVW